MYVNKGSRKVKKPKMEEKRSKLFSAWLHFFDDSSLVYIEALFIVSCLLWMLR